MKIGFLNITLILLFQILFSVGLFAQINNNAISKLIQADSLLNNGKINAAVKQLKDVQNEHYFAENIMFYKISETYFNIQNIDSAVFFLKEAIQSGYKKWSIKAIEFDPLIVALSKFDSTLYQGVFENTWEWIKSDSICTQKSLLDSLEILKRIDQKNRVAGQKIADSIWVRQKIQDTLSLEFVEKEISKINKWLGYKEVGKTGESACFLIIQHSENENVYEKYFEILHRAILSNNAPPSHYAMVIDRWLIIKNNTQLFGTQVEMLNGKASPKGHLLIEQKIDLLREYFELPPLLFYLDQMTKLNGSN